MSTNRTRKPASSIPTAYGGHQPARRNRNQLLSRKRQDAAVLRTYHSPRRSFGHEIAPYNDEERTITRHIHSRVVMNYHTARAMLEWLEDKVAALEAEEDGSAPLSFDESGFQHQ